MVERLHFNGRVESGTRCIEKFINRFGTVPLGGELGGEILAGSEEAVEALWRLADISPFVVLLAHDS